ncbi:hypothetical protein NQ318_017017, partial [Aromia moschata]
MLSTVVVLKMTSDPQQPLHRMLNTVVVFNTLFSKLKEKNPDILKRIIPVNGDVKEIKLGMAEEDRRTIIENVNIIYHSAASVRFDDFLKDAVLLNTRGTREISNLALEVKNLVAFMHISTTYCNTDKKVIEEQLYPPHADWREVIAVAEQLDQHICDIFATKYIDPFLNTYTFSKSLAEHVVNDLCKGKVPTVIFRPSVGILRVCYSDPDSTQDYIPVDVATRMLIVATKERGLNENLNELPVFNAALGQSVRMKTQKLLELGKKLTWDSPYAKMLWYPNFSVTNNWYIFYIQCLLFHIFPALLIDGLLKLSRKKTMLIKVQRKIYIANMALSYFMENSWNFVNAKAISLSDNLLECDKDNFAIKSLLPMHDDEIYAYYMKAKRATVKYLFKEEFNFDVAYRNTV